MWFVCGLEEMIADNCLLQIECGCPSLFLFADMSLEVPQRDRLVHVLAC